VRVELSQAGLDIQDPSEFFSFRSPSFRKLGMERNSINSDTLIDLMLSEPRLIRRPLISIGTQTIVGTDRKSLAEILG
jgi:arsenate reductase-like glutaredoxin family protein